MRYGSKSLQALGGLMIVIIYILYIIIQIRGFGIVISEFLDINYTFSILLVYLFVMYTTFGGLFSVARTDSLNIFLIVIGVFLAAGLILKEAGGLTEMHQQAALIDTKAFPRSSAGYRTGRIAGAVFRRGSSPPSNHYLFVWMGIRAGSKSTVCHPD